jgi:hypothetical protein
MPPTDFSAKSDPDLNQWIANYERKPGGTTEPFYHELLEEQARRAQAKQQLNLERSMEHLKQTAIQQVCTTYGDLAKASDVEWSKAHRQMNGPKGHLALLLGLCHARGLPLLTAVCVNQAGVTKGELEGEALAGFVAGAKRLGFSVTDERDFHHKHRDACWQWGQKQTAAGSAK